MSSSGPIEVPALGPSGEFRAANRLIEVPALGPSGEFRAANRLSVTDVTGAALAEVSLVPPVYVHRAMATLHRAKSLPAADRAALLAEAAKLFEHATIGGLSPA